MRNAYGSSISQCWPSVLKQRAVLGNPQAGHERTCPVNVCGMMDLAGCLPLDANNGLAIPRHLGHEMPWSLVYCSATLDHVGRLSS